MNIPKYKGRPLILFPEGWDIDEERFNGWSLEDWKNFRTDYYLGIRLSPFGYDDNVPYAWPGKPYAPHGMSINCVPRLHPADE